DHVFHLAGHVPPPRRTRADHASPALLRVLELLDTPAHITSDLGVVLGQNARSEALLGRLTGRRGLERSVFFRWFTDPSARERWHPDEHAQHGRGYVAALRTAHGRDPDGESREMVDALLAASAEFAALWERHDVTPHTQTRKRVVHPLVGEMALDCQILTADNAVELLVVFTAPPGSEDAERLRLLEVVGTQTFG
ncbi:MAG TPA: transcriptional regulator, partial [Solirubrobacteraceae bacterium]|nr:transcriptional regulator [Solirubrobacteraceae bacterium]